MQTQSTFIKKLQERERTVAENGAHESASD